MKLSTSNPVSDEKAQYNLMNGLDLKAITRLHSILCRKDFYLLSNVTDYSVEYPAESIMTMKIPQEMTEHLQKLKYYQTLTVARMWCHSIEAARLNLTEEDCQRQLIRLMGIANNPQKSPLLFVRLNKVEKAKAQFKSEARTIQIA